MLSNRSETFKRYNQMKRTAADPKRLNRALGVAQSKQERPYVTTAEGCSCKDWEFRGSKTGTPCKHMTALALVAPAVEVAPTRETILADANSFLFGD